MPRVWCTATCIMSAVSNKVKEAWGPSVWCGGREGGKRRLTKLRARSNAEAAIVCLSSFRSSVEFFFFSGAIGEGEEKVVMLPTVQRKDKHEEKNNCDGFVRNRHMTSMSFPHLDGLERRAPNAKRGIGHSPVRPSIRPSVGLPDCCLLAEPRKRWGISAFHTLSGEKRATSQPMQQEKKTAERDWLVSVRANGMEGKRQEQHYFFLALGPFDRNCNRLPWRPIHVQPTQ